MSILDNIINRGYILVRSTLIFLILAILCLLFGPLLLVGVIISSLIYILFGDIKMQDGLVSWRNQDEHIRRN